MTLYFFKVGVRPISAKMTTARAPGSPVKALSANRLNPYTFEAWSGNLDIAISTIPCANFGVFTRYSFDPGEVLVVADMKLEPEDRLLLYKRPMMPDNYISYGDSFLCDPYNNCLDYLSCSCFNYGWEDWEHWWYMINHSDDPNATVSVYWMEDGWRRVVWKASKPIKAGSEIFWKYRDNVTFNNAVPAIRYINPMNRDWSKLPTDIMKYEGETVACWVRRLALTGKLQQAAKCPRFLTLINGITKHFHPSWKDLRTKLFVLCNAASPSILRVVYGESMQAWLQRMRILEIDETSYVGYVLVDYPLPFGLE